MSTDQYLDENAYLRYQNLDSNGLVQVEYVWIGGNGGDLRSKCRTLPSPINSLADIPEWNYDGSSTNQASGHFSEIIIKPRSIFRDPFRLGENIIVMCDTYLPGGEPHKTNTRVEAEELFNHKLDEEPWFGIEQEYTIFTLDKHPFGWPKRGYPAPQGPYYCGIGADKAFGRPLVEAHYKCCLYAGVRISGVNGEVMPGQWEFQVGPCTGIASGDQLWIARYIMQRLAEQFGVLVSFDPKPISGDWNGAGCHTNYSTKAMRSPGGFDVIKAAIEKLGRKHLEHIEHYGEGNARRLTGHHETAPIDKFSWGVGNRGASIRVPTQTEKDGYGYFEDRRPAANMDPYVVTSKIFKTTVLE